MDNNKYKYKYSDVPGRIEEGVPPRYSDVSSSPAYPPAYSDVPSTSAYPPALPVVAPGVPVNPAPASGYIIPGRPRGTPPVIVQPQVVRVQAPVIPEYEAPDHLGMAVFVTICCCWPLGLVAILKATKCRSARMRGDRDNALLYGNQAKKFATLGLRIGIFITVVTLAIQFILMIVADIHRMKMERLYQLYRGQKPPFP